ncbi:hypothetical protein [Sphingomonas sp.]|uniref:hypothetical protein n=1 Tax=Sphingomonas sp. TaxID=28214 RepID=UPI003B002CB5
MFEALTTDCADSFVLLESIVVRAHQQAANGKGKSASGAGARATWSDDQGPWPGGRGRSIAAPDGIAGQAGNALRAAIVS